MPVGTQNLANFDALLKEYYTPDRVAKLMLLDSPAMAMFKKFQMYGSSWELPVLFAGTAGRSASFANALTNKGSTTSTKFQITTNANYSLAQLDRLLMLASQKNVGAFLPAAKTLIDDAFAQLRRSLAINLFRDGSGARGRIATLTSGNTVVTLTNRTDIVNFQVGDLIQLAGTKTGGSVRGGSPGTATITAVNRVAGSFTVSADITSVITSAQANDWIYQMGDYDQALKGLGAWVPDAAPGATAFFGVNRSVDSMLGGTRYNGSGMLRYEALIDGQSEIAMIGGGKPTHAFCSPVDFRELVKELEAQTRRPRPVDITLPVRKGSNATVGFEGIAIEGDAGTIQVYADRFCEPNKCYILTLDDWRLAHIGPELADIVGRDSDAGMLIDNASDGYEVRCVSYSQLTCAAPGRSGVVTSWGQ